MKILVIIVSLTCSLLSWPAFPCEIIKGKVVAVKDGDTIVILKKKKEVAIRLAGVDAPEKNQAFGQRAKQFTAAMIFGKTVKVMILGEDRNDRKIGEVFIEDRSLNEELVPAGLAWQDPRFSKSLGIAALQNQAKGERKGLWVDSQPAPPWEFREDGE